MDISCPQCKLDTTAGRKCYWCNADVPHPAQEPATTTTVPIYTLDKREPYAIVRKGQIQPAELEGTFEGKNGFRIMWNDNPAKASVEVKNKNGEWVPLPGVQRIDISLSVDDYLPRVNVQHVVIPKPISPPTGPPMPSLDLDIKSTKIKVK